MSLLINLSHHEGLLFSFGIFFIVLLITILWPRSKDDSRPVRARGLSLIAVLLAVVVLIGTTTSDQKSAADTNAHLQTLENKQEQMQSKLNSMGVEKEQLQKLLSASDEERHRASLETRELRASLLNAASAVADISDPKRLRIKETVLFDSGQAVLRCDGKETLAKLLGFLTAQLLGKPSQIFIEGHTDNKKRGKFDNQELSERRAQAVRE